MKAATAYIGVGSNIGDKLSNCKHSLQRIEQLPGCEVSACSDLFKTEPEGFTGHDWYANCVAEVKTTCTPMQLLESLLAIEHDMGRRRSRRWEPRIIDLDILLFGQEIIESSDLVVPHPLLCKRRFVLEPLAQLAPKLIHPALNITIEELLNQLPKVSSVEILKEDL